MSIRALVLLCLFQVPLKIHFLLFHIMKVSHLFMVLGKGGGTGEKFTWTLRADVNVDSLADLHVCKMDLVGMHSFDVKDKVALGFQALALAP